MDKYLEQTREFSKVMGQPVDVNILGEGLTDLLQLRKRLITEEYYEFSDEVKRLIDSGVNPSVDRKKVLAALLKEYADLQYVLSGFGATFGFPTEEVFQRVQDSNMSKLGDDGKPMYDEGGKVQKGPNYKKPDLTDIVEKYVADHFSAE